MQEECGPNSLNLESIYRHNAKVSSNVVCKITYRNVKIVFLTKPVVVL